MKFTSIVRNLNKRYKVKTFQRLMHLQNSTVKSCFDANILAIIAHLTKV